MVGFNMVVTSWYSLQGDIAGFSRLFCGILVYQSIARD
jgi:hypothetical protein